MKVRIATRKSALALVQTRWVANWIQTHHAGVEIEEVPIVTQGDKRQDISLASIGGKGLFITEIEEALLHNQADFAVHSLKDVPSELAAGLSIVCVPERQDPRDILLSTHGTDLPGLPPNARIGTSSLRRSAQLTLLRQDLRFEGLRGNVDTRIRKLTELGLDAIVLAAAGIRRLGLEQTLKFLTLPIEVCVPAVGQGALAIEAREDNVWVRKLLQELESSAARICVEAERTFLRDIGGNCYAPLAAHAFFETPQSMELHGFVANAAGTRHLRHALRATIAHDNYEIALRAAQDLGSQLAQKLRAEGADRLLTSDGV